MFRDLSASIFNMVTYFYPFCCRLSMQAGVVRSYYSHADEPVAMHKCIVQKAHKQGRTDLSTVLHKWQMIRHFKALLVLLDLNLVLHHRFGVPN